jgi:hypothetical protein
MYQASRSGSRNFQNNFEIGPNAVQSRPGRECARTARSAAMNKADQMPKTLTDIRSLARSYGPEMVRVLASIARQKSAPPSARAAAASSLLDRGYGKAEQSVDQKTDLQITIRQILDAPTQPKLVTGRVVDSIQPNVSGMPATSANQKGGSKPKPPSD